MVIGLAAYRFVNNDVEFNKSQIEKGLKAAHGKADLICFGETFLQGFDAMNWCFPHDKDIAVSQDSETLRELCAMSGQYGVALLLGYLEREGDKLYSSCAILANGRILHNYRRISVGWKEYTQTDEHYCEGTASEDFWFEGRRFRIALCGDLWEFPERFSTDGTLLWPVYVNFSRVEWEQYEQEYADQAKLAASKTLLVNSISREPEAIGGAFCFENGSITSRLCYEEEEILYVDI